MNPHTICHDRGVRTVAVSTLPSFYSKSSGSDDYAAARADVGGQTSSSRIGCTVPTPPLSVSSHSNTQTPPWGWRHYGMTSCTYPSWVTLSLPASSPTGSVPRLLLREPFVRHVDLEFTLDLT